MRKTIGFLTPAESVRLFQLRGAIRRPSYLGGSMRTLTLADVESAPKRSFSAGSAIAQDLSAWYEAADWSAVAGFMLGEKDDEGRDGSDAQLRDAVCLLAGLKREREAVLGDDGKQEVSAKRG